MAKRPQGSVKPPKIKICGITNADDARAAVDAGADALGFVFYRKSPRYVEPEAAKRIVAALPPFVLAVGVFVNEDAKRVRDLMDGCGLALAQLHGDETAAYCETLGRPVLRAIRLRSAADLLPMASIAAGRASVGSSSMRMLRMRTAGPDGRSTGRWRPKRRRLRR
jgi:phosphoribosylanthranilate isomerase